MARLHTTEEILRLIRLRTVSALVRGESPGPEASIRKVMADDGKLEEEIRRTVRQVAMEEIGKKPEVTVVISRLVAE